MTGYTVHTGTSKKYAAGWDEIFKGKSKSKPKAKKATAKKATSKANKGKKKS